MHLNICNKVNINKYLIDEFAKYVAATSKEPKSFDRGYWELDNYCEWVTDKNPNPYITKEEQCYNNVYGLKFDGELICQQEYIRRIEMREKPYYEETHHTLSKLETMQVSEYTLFDKKREFYVRKNMKRTLQGDENQGSLLFEHKGGGLVSKLSSLLDDPSNWKNYLSAKIGLNFTGLLINEYTWKLVNNHFGDAVLCSERHDYDEILNFECDSNGAYKISMVNSGALLGMLNEQLNDWNVVGFYEEDKVHNHKWLINVHGLEGNEGIKCVICNESSPDKVFDTSSGIGSILMERHNGKEQIFYIYKVSPEVHCG